MKAYVIKNKEGKYYCIDNIFRENILNAYIWVIEQYAKLHIKLNRFKDCKIVEITIAEGDLEKENQLLRKRQNDFCDIVVLTIENWLQQEGFYEEEFEDLFDLIRELKWNNDRDK